MKNFAMTGVAGYIAPRHMKAIYETGNNLLAGVDKADNVGILDSYFPDCSFFTEFERFDRYLEKQRRIGVKLDYLSVCTPNYLHDAHIRYGLRIGSDVICEKPIVLNPWNLDALQEIENEVPNRVNTILQLRLHPSIIEIKKKFDNDTSRKIHNIDLTYITSRGKWYDASWKADIHKSGGVATNIGIHFFDMLMRIFGSVKKNTVNILDERKTAGYLQLEKANIRWFLSINSEDLPKQAVDAGMRTYRSITIDGQEIEFSGGFTDLHTVSYQKILAGEGFGLEDARPSIQVAYDIRNAKPVGLVGEYHPFLKN